MESWWRRLEIESTISVEDMAKNIGPAFSTAVGRSLGTLSGKLTITQANLRPFDITVGELQIPSSPCCSTARRRR